MGYTLNVDLWQWVNPETQKVTTLRRGDKVPPEALEAEGVNVDELSKGYAPSFLPDGSDEGQALRATRESEDEATTNESARTSAAQRSSSPKVAES